MGNLSFQPRRNCNFPILPLKFYSYLLRPTLLSAKIGEWYMAQRTLLEYTSNLPSSACAKQLTFRMENMGQSILERHKISLLWQLCVALVHSAIWRQELQEKPWGKECCCSYVQPILLDQSILRVLKRHFVLLHLLSLPSSTDFLLSPCPWRKNTVYGSKLLKGPQSCREVREEAGQWYLLSSSSFLIQKKETVRTASFPTVWFWVQSQEIVDGTFWT